MSAHVSRIVALGASNLTRGFPTVVATARAAWGPDVEVLAALGHGRSYGARSRVLFRSLPGVLDAGLWAALDSRPRRVTRAVVTDVGNDILYGFSAERTLDWVEEALRRLRRVTDDIVLTDLPLAGIRRSSRWKFLAFRSVLYPASRLSFGEVLDRTQRVHAGLADLAAAYESKLVPLDSAWYGFDPIHVRRSARPEAWRQILGVQHVAQLPPQSGVPMPSGPRVWLY